MTDAENFIVPPGVSPGVAEIAEEFRAGQSTSARLRQLQQDYAASQADLTRVEAERDGLLDDRDWWRTAAKTADRITDETAATADLLREELASARTELASARTERDRFVKAADKLHGEWLDLKAELEQLRRSAHWIVARDTGPACERCDQPVQRGQAYELLADIDTVRHIHCDPNGAPTP